MFDNEKSCMGIMVFGTIAYLAGLFFILRAAKDMAIMWVLAVILLCVCASILGKAAKTLFAEGTIAKFIAGLFIGTFAVGTILVVYFVFIF